MPAYSFQQHFVPFVLDGSKPHTIRKRRARGFAKKSDTLYLYYGMRTKWCKKLREEICTDARTIIIDASNIYILDKRLTDQELSAEPFNKFLTKKNQLTKKTANELAWKDGFRATPNISGINHFDIMLRWWRKTHQLPFIGDIIYWDPKNIESSE